MNFALRGAWLCHTGRARQRNEDACLAAGVLSRGSDSLPQRMRADEAPWLVAVSDGIGGHQAGATASRAVVEALADCQRITPAKIGGILQRLNQELFERGSKEPEFEGMGATVAGLGCGSQGLFAFNVGDSRVYRVEEEQLRQITRDDSEAEELREMGLLAVADDLRPGSLHALTQAVGGRTELTEIEVHFHPLKVQERARFLICSDGLTDMAGRTAIGEILIRENAPERVAEALFHLAMDAGGLDNITLAVVDVERPSRSRRDSAQS